MKFICIKLHIWRLHVSLMIISIPSDAESITLTDITLGYILTAVIRLQSYKSFAEFRGILWKYLYLFELIALCWVDPNHIARRVLRLQTEERLPDVEGAANIFLNSRGQRKSVIFLFQFGRGANNYPLQKLTRLRNISQSFGWGCWLLCVG
jgi:hypothetical protein